MTNRIFKIFAIFLLTQSLFIGCKKENKIFINEKITRFNKFPEEIKLSFKKLFEYKKGVPHNIFPVDSSLIIFNSNKSIDYFYYIYSLKNRKLSEGLVRKGRGANEGYGVASTGINRSVLWLHDVTLKKIMTIDKSKILADSIPLNFNEYKISDNYYKIDFIDSLRFLAVGRSDLSSKISMVDVASAKDIINYGSYCSMSEEIPLEAFKDAYTSYIYVKPSGNKVVLPYRYTDVVEIYDTEERTNISAIQGPSGFDVDFTVKNQTGYPYMSKTEKTRKAFVNGMVTDNYIYMIYSGHTRDEPNWSYGKQVYVYDWEGNPIKKILLDRYIYTIGISDDDKILYSFDKETGDIIYANL